MEDKMQCSQCGSEIRSGVNFCSECGAAFEQSDKPRTNALTNNSKPIARAGGRGVKIGIAIIAFAGVSFGVWVYLGTPIPTALVGLDLPFMGRQGVVTHDTTFYPGADVNAVVSALIANQLLGDVGGLCDQGITCEGRQIIKAGTHVRVVKEITMQNGRLNVTFAQVLVGTTEGWVASNAVR
jgi:zinc-ribbon domain